MRRTSVLGIVAALSVSTLATSCATPQASSSERVPLGEAAKKWQSSEQPQEFLDFFRGTFHKLGITVEETGEQFTVVHEGDKFTFHAGVADVDFIVPVRQQNVDSLMGRAADGKLDDEDAFAIMKLMFTPLTREILRHPVTADDNLRKMSGVEDHIHVILLDPQGNEGASHTLVYQDNKWEVTPGLIGTPSRTFRMTAQQALDYQRHAFEAMQKNNPIAWAAFSGWYKEWRESCSTTART